MTKIKQIISVLVILASAYFIIENHEYKNYILFILIASSIYFGYVKGKANRGEGNSPPPTSLPQLPNQIEPQEFKMENERAKGVYVGDGLEKLNNDESLTEIKEHIRQYG